MAGMNLGSDAGESLFCSSCLSRSESGVPGYTPLHSTSPFFFTEQMNATCASFWPFLIKSCVSIRSIKEFGPLLSKIGRYIGKPAVCVDGISVTCPLARWTIDKKPSSEKANERMGRYASGARRFCKGKVVDLRHSGQAIAGRNFAHYLMPTKIIDECVARLHVMHNAIGRWRLKQSTEFHKTMAGTARVERIECNLISFISLEPTPIDERHGIDAAIITAPFRHNIESE